VRHHHHRSALRAAHIRGHLSLHHHHHGAYRVITTLTLATLPTARTDGSSVSAADLTSANVYKNGAQYATIAGPLSNGQTWSDTVPAANGDKYDVTILDAQTPPVEGVASNNYVVSIAAPPLAPLAAAVISGATA